MSPEQRIRIRTRVLLGELGYPVFNFTPTDEGDFPLLSIGEQFKQNERLNIDKLNGRTQITVHIWHDNPRQEGTVMNISNKIERMFLKEYGLNGEDINTQLLVDDSTGKRLLHGIVEVDIKF